MRDILLVAVVGLVLLVSSYRRANPALSWRVAELEIETARLRQKNALLQCQLASVSSALHDARESVVHTNRAAARARRREIAS